MEKVSIFLKVFNALKWIYDHTPGIRRYRLNREFIRCCKDRDLTGVEAALVGGADVNFKDEQGKPALIIAVSVDSDTRLVPPRSFELVNLLLRYGLENEGKRRLKVDARDDKGNTALIMASRNGQSEIVEKLITKGKAKVNAKNDEGWTALMRAEKHGYSETSRILMEHGAQ